MAFPEFLCFVGLVAGVFFGIGLARSSFGVHPALGGVIGGVLGFGGRIYRGVAWQAVFQIF